MLHTADHMMMSAKYYGCAALAQVLRGGVRFDVAVRDDGCKSVSCDVMSCHPIPCCPMSLLVAPRRDRCVDRT